MTEDKKLSQDQAHAFFCVHYNHKIWPLLEKEELTEDEKEDLLAYAFASLIHWAENKLGTMANRQRGLYLVAKAFIHGGDAPNAWKYAQKCLAVTNENLDLMEDYDLGFAQEVVARAAAMNGKKELYEKHYAEALRLGELIVDEQDKKIYMADLKGGPWFIS